MSLAKNKAIARRELEELWSKGKLAVADEIFSANFVVNIAGTFSGTGTPESIKQAVSAWRTSFPDIHYTVEEQIAEGDKVMTRWRFSGTQHGELQGIAPTGKKIEVDGIGIHRIVDDRIVE